MIVFLGSGNLTSELKYYAQLGGIETAVISSSNPSSDKYKVSRNLNGLCKISLPDNCTLCIITWTMHPKGRREMLSRGIDSVVKLAEFIKTHQKVQFLYFSSSVSTMDLALESEYAKFKLISESLLERMCFNNLALLRPGLIYGGKGCPLKLLTRYWKMGIYIIPGSLDAEMAVTSISCIKKVVFAYYNRVYQRYGLNCHGTFDSFEADSFKLRTLYALIPRSKHLNMRIRLDNKSWLYRILLVSGLFRVDLSLASINRFTNPTNSISGYIDGIVEYVIKIVRENA